MRIEDLDRPREVAGSADGILRTLERFGFEWDSLTRQSERSELYVDALRDLEARHLTFACTCSRAQLEDELRYPGTCRDRQAAAGVPSATRLRVDSREIRFTDRIQGTFRQQLAVAVGDIILKRRDQIVAYVLAVVVDDAAQGVTHIVRGAASRRARIRPSRCCSASFRCWDWHRPPRSSRSQSLRPGLGQSSIGASIRCPGASICL